MNGIQRAAATLTRYLGGWRVEWQADGETVATGPELPPAPRQWYLVHPDPNHPVIPVAHGSALVAVTGDGQRVGLTVHDPLTTRQAIYAITTTDRDAWGTA